MIHLDLHIAADHPDELADAFRFLPDRGITLQPARSDIDHVASASNVVSLADRRQEERHA